MNNLEIVALAAFASCVGMFIFVPLILGLARLFGLYTIVEERTCKVYMLFGKVVGQLDEPGLHFLLPRLGLRCLIINFAGRCHELDMALDQAYLRSQAVNSEEGAPMGIGIWYEMFISNPVSYLFKNADPRGSLDANVGNATVRCLSNMKLAEMLENRHAMSITVRTEVSPQSEEWGYKLGSVYIRKVHFRDKGMIQQIEGKGGQPSAPGHQPPSNRMGPIRSASSPARRAPRPRSSSAKPRRSRPQVVGSARRKSPRTPKSPRSCSRSWKPKI